MILLLAAMEWEVAPLRHGRAFDSQAVAIGVTGIGPHLAQTGAARFIHQYEPDWVVGLGLCGGLAATTRTGDVVVPAELVSSRTGEVINASPTDVLVQEGRMLSVDKVVITPHDKRRMGDTYHATWVDQESYDWCLAATSAGIRCLVVRVVLDAAADYLPSWRQPGSWRSALTLPSRALAARKNLAAAGRRVICELL